MIFVYNSKFHMGVFAISSILIRYIFKHTLYLIKKKKKTQTHNTGSTYIEPYIYIHTYPRVETMKILQSKRNVRRALEFFLHAWVLIYQGRIYHHHHNHHTLNNN